MTKRQGLFLGIDTSTPWRSVGLSDSTGFEASLNWKVTRNEGRDLLSKIEGLLGCHDLTPQDLSGIGIANGPGSFTALRVGVSVAQGLSMGLDIPVVPIGSLDSYPYALDENHKRTTVILPARSGEMFVQTYERNPDLSWERENVIECLSVEDLNDSVKDPGIWVGPALHYYEEEILAIFGDEVQTGGETCRVPIGSWIARLGQSKFQENPDKFTAESVEIEYHQSHGALTIEQRKRAKPDA